MNISRAVLTLLCLVVALAHAAKVPRTLLAAEDPATINELAGVQAVLEGLGHDVVVRTDAIDLMEFGVPKYDNAVWVGSGRVQKFPYKQATEFVDAGGNLNIAVHGHVPSNELRLFARFVGVELDEAGTQVVDIDHDAFSSGTSTHISAAALNQQVPATIRSYSTIPSGGDIEYVGMGMLLPNDAILAFPILSAPATAVSTFTDRGAIVQSMAVGEKLVLVAGMEARNGARVIMSGSSQFLLDGSISRSPNAMPLLAKGMLEWAFRESGVLTITDMVHAPRGETEPLQVYVHGQEIRVSCRFKERRHGHEIPYTADDIQFELIRVDPYYVINMQHQGDGIYVVDLKLPDVNGIYKARIAYRRFGLGEVSETQTVIIRPVATTMYERFIVDAYPYYLSAAMVMVASTLITVVVIYHPDGVGAPHEKVVEKKNQ
eukprot:Clim_evm3s223 gene=Clim_evmTU3s223